MDKCGFYQAGHCDGCEHPVYDQCLKCDYNFGCEICWHENGGYCEVYKIFLDKENDNE